MCTISRKKVKWTLDPEFTKQIKKSLNTDKVEKAGVLLFEDSACKNGVCNKTSTKFKINKGNGASVYTPNGIINFHTHPKSAYRGENAFYGWPSGEDMSQCINFAKDGNLIHIVFTLEGAYIIKVNKILNKKNAKMLEKIFKTTHVFRSANQLTQLKNFRKTFKGISGKTTKDIWLNLANGLTLKKLYTLNNLINAEKLKVPNDSDNIFEVSLAPINGPLTFRANYVPESCHLMNFNRN
tara:strand:+ start:1386 stop:2102 length:717 start_codon:yes stop_codon:yes gene_type:complete